MEIIVTAVASSLLTGAVVFALWRYRLLPELEASADRFAREATERALADLQTTVDETIPQLRRAVRDGAQDAILNPPTERLGQTAKGVTNAGVTVIETTLRRWFGPPPQR